MNHAENQIDSPLFPAWFRGLVIALATLVLSACQSTTPVAERFDDLAAPAGPGGGEPREQRLRRSFPVQQAQYASQAWVDAAPTEPYYGPVAPCACHGGTCVPDACNTLAGSHAVVGPSDEYLCDGGDFRTPAGVRQDWVIEGLEQEDTISHYDTLDGRVIVEPSNRVCIYAPRFGAVRRVDNLLVNQHRVGPGGIIDEMALAAADRSDVPATSLQQHMPLANLGDRPANVFRSRQQPGGVQARIAAADLQTFLAPQLNLAVVRLGVIDNAEKPWLAKAIVSAYTWAADVSAQVVVDNKQLQQQIGRTQPGQVYSIDEPDAPQIRLIKLASTGAAQLGEEVEFALRFDNVGDQPIGNVTIVDNLATRLEYVPDSAKATVDADFSTEPNEGGSLILRWEITKPLQPGQGGVLRFKAKVR